MSQGLCERKRITAQFPLGNSAVLVLIGVFNRVFDGNDAAVLIQVKMFNHGRQGRGLAAAGRAANDYKSPGSLNQIFTYFGQAEVIDTGEECDDGNTEDGDGCSSTCSVERCDVGVIQPTANLRGVKVGSFDAWFSYAADVWANGYFTWYVGAKQLIPDARQGGSGQNPPGCAPAPGTTCMHPDAIDPGPGRVLFYQVRGACDGQEAAE